MKTSLKNQKAFSLMEIVVVIVIVSLIALFAIPAYLDTVKRAHVVKMTSKLGTFRLPLTDQYMATASWPSSINGVSSGATASDSFFDDAVNFRYNTLDNKAWVGYELSSDYGSGWVFLVIVANDDDSFEMHCGSLNDTCTLGICNSGDLYPIACSEEDMDASYTLE